VKLRTTIKQLTTVHIPMRFGQSLMPEVMEGLALNDCASVLSCIDSGERRENMHANQVKLFAIGGDPVFIMDSDVIMVKGVVAAMREQYNGNMVLYPNGVGSRPHGLFAVARKVIDAIPYNYYGESQCPMCAWIKELEKHFPVARIKAAPLQEIKRANERKALCQ